MRILAIHSAHHEDQNKRSAVDQWRLARPIRELKKHRPDWEIVERATVIPEIQRYKSKEEFTEIELERAFLDVSGFDIVFSAYQSNPSIYTLLQVARERHGTQYIL